ncbi:preprotein translocase subunit-like protein [Stylonychia lemnae]|uniref:Preprotein translocase subunit-like protein n=1 Tax=Stylonychia lemnae TaxID=5949 RepID=A0A078AY90_STYLE|nr:preprotein translocase subunit-like protein [Stylonychia lemnae]|eukprot:CDW85763.1 preprotein translocase subunit-like protein [Stylonychia lemnae]
MIQINALLIGQNLYIDNKKGLIRSAENILKNFHQNYKKNDQHMIVIYPLIDEEEQLFFINMTYSPEFKKSENLTYWQVSKTQGENRIFFAHLEINLDKKSKSICSIYQENDAFIESCFTPEVKEFFQESLELTDSQYSIEFLKPQSLIDEQHAGVEVAQIGLNILQQKQQIYCMSVADILNLRQEHFSISDSKANPINQYIKNQEQNFDLEDQLLEFYILLEDKQQRKFLQISKALYEKEGEEAQGPKQNEVLAKLEKFFLKYKDFMLQIPMNHHQNLNEYLMTQSVPFILRQDKILDLKNSIIQCLEHIREELQGQENEDYENLNNEMSLEVYQQFISERKKFESRKEKKEDINVLDNMSYFYYDNQIYCKTLTGKFLTETGDDASYSDLVCMLLQYIKINFKITCIPNNDDQQIDDDLKTIIKKIQQTKQKLGKSSIVKYLNKKFSVDLIDGSKCKDFIGDQRKLYYWPVVYQDDYECYETTLVKMERIYTNPTEVYEFLLNIIENESSLYTILEYFMKYLYERSKASFQEFLDSVTNSLKKNISVSELWKVISDSVRSGNFSNDNPDQALILKHTYIMDTLVEQIEHCKQSTEKMFLFRMRQDLKSYIQEINLQIIKENTYKENQQSLALQLEEIKFLQEQKHLEKEIENQKERIKEQNEAISKLEKELQKTQSEDKKKELEAQMAKLSKQKEELDLQNQDMVYKKFYNSIYKGLKKHTEQVSLNLFDKSSTLGEVINQLKTQLIIDKTYMEKIWSEITGLGQEDLNSFNNFVNRNSQNKKYADEIKAKWAVLFAKPVVKLSNGILQISGNFFSMTTVKSQYEQFINQAKEILIIAIEQLIWDVNLIAPSKNVAIEAKVIFVKFKECVIDTSSPNQSKQSQDQLNDWQRQNKRDPIHGKHGLAGESAGNIMIKAFEDIQWKECLKLKANGARGQDGTNGLDGYNGAQGKHGRDGLSMCKDKESPNVFKTSTLGNEHKIWYGTKRGLGSDAGLGGNAGVGGEGGYHGQISVTIGNKKATLNLEQKKGSNGNDGVEGNGGTPGKDGLNGVDCHEYNQWATKMHYDEGDLKLEEEIGIFGKRSYECRILKNKYDYERYGMNDYSKDQNGLLKDLRGLKATQQQNKKQKSAQKQAINQALIDSIFQQKSQELISAETQKQVQVISQKETKETQQKIDQLQKTQDANKQKQSQIQKSNQMAQNKKQSEALKLQEKQMMLSNQKQAIMQNQKKQQDVAQKINEQNKQLMQMNQNIEQIDVTSQQVQQQVTQEATYKEDKSKIKNEPNKSFEWDIGHNQIVLPDLSEYMRIDQEKLIYFLQNLKINHPAQINLIEKFLEMVDTFILLMRNLYHDKKVQAFIKSIKDCLENIYHQGLRQTLNSISVIISKVALILKQNPVKTLIEQDMLEVLLYKDIIEPHYLSECKKHADKIFEQLMYKIQLMEKEEAISTLKIAISLKNNVPDTPLSKVFHFTVGVLSKFMRADKGIKKNSFINIITEIEKMISTLQSSQSSTHHHSSEGIKEFSLLSCSLYNHYFQRTIKYDDYPLDMMMYHFNFYQKSEQFVEVIKLFANLVEDTNTHTYYLPHLLGYNGKSFLLTVQQNISLIYFTMEEVCLIKSYIDKVVAIIIEGQSLFNSISSQIQSIKIMIDQKWEKWLHANDRLNKILITIKMQQTITNEVFKSAMEAHYYLETAKIDLLRKQIFANQIKEVLFASTSDLASQIKLQEITEEIKRRHSLQLIKGQTSQKWYIIKQNLIKIGKRLIFENQASEQVLHSHKVEVPTAFINQMSQSEFRDWIVKSCYSGDQYQVKEQLEVLLEKFYSKTDGQSNFQNDQFLRQMLVKISQRQQSYFYEKDLKLILLNILNQWIELQKLGKNDLQHFESTLDYRGNLNFTSYIVQKCLNEDAEDFLEKYYDQFNLQERKNFKNQNKEFNNLIKQIESYQAIKKYFETMKSKIERDPSLISEQKRIKSDFKKLAAFTFDNFFKLECNIPFEDIMKHCYEQYIDGYDTQLAKLKTISKIFGVKSTTKEKLGLSQQKGKKLIHKLEKIIEKDPECASFIIKIMDFDTTELLSSTNSVLLKQNSARIEESIILIDLRNTVSKLFKEKVFQDIENRLNDIFQDFEDDMIEINATLKYKIISILQALKQFSQYIFDPQGCKEMLNNLVHEIQSRAKLDLDLIERFKKQVRLVSRVKVELITKESEQLYGTSERNKEKDALIQLSKEFNEFQDSEQFTYQQNFVLCNSLIKKIFDIIKVQDQKQKGRIHDQEQLKQVFAVCMITFCINQISEKDILSLIKDSKDFKIRFKQQNQWKHLLVDYFKTELQFTLILQKKEDLFNRCMDYNQWLSQSKLKISSILDIIAKLPEFEGNDRTSSIDRLNKNLSILLVGAHKQGLLKSSSKQLKILKNQIEKIHKSINDSNQESKVQEIDSLIQKQSLDFMQNFIRIEAYNKDNLMNLIIQDLQKITESVRGEPNVKKMHEYVTNQQDYLQEINKIIQLTPFSSQQINSLKALHQKLDSAYYISGSQIFQNLSNEVMSQIKSDKCSLLLQYESEIFSSIEITDKFYKYASKVGEKYLQIYQESKSVSKAVSEFENLIYSQQFIINDSLKINMSHIDKFSIHNPKKALYDIKDLQYNNKEEVENFLILHRSLNEDDVLSPSMCSQLKDIYDILLFVNDQQKQTIFQKLIKLIKEKEIEDQEEEEDSELLKQLKNTFANFTSNSISKLLNSDENQDSINQFIENDFESTIRQIRITFKLQNKGNQKLLQFLYQNENIINLNQEHRASFIQALQLAYRQETNENQDDNYLLVHMKQSIQNESTQKQLEFIKMLQSIENQHLIDILNNLSKSKLTYINRIWSILIQKDYSNWKEEVFIMTAYYICSLWIENLEPLDVKLQEDKDYLDQRMKKVKGLLAALTQQRFNLNENKLNKFNDIIKTVSLKTNSYKSDYISQVSVRNLEQFLLIIDQKDNFEVIINILEQYRPIIWHQKLLIYSCERSINEFFSKQNGIISTQQLKIKQSITKGLKYIQESVGILETIKCLLDEEIDSESESLFLSYESLLNVITKLVQLKKKNLLTDSVVQQLKGGQINDIQIQIMKILIRQELNYSEDNILHKNIVSGLYSFSQFYGESKLQLLISLIVKAFKKQKTYDPQDLLILLQKINNRRIILNQQSFEIMEKESDISIWAKLLQKEAEIKKIRDEKNKQKLSQDELLRFECNNLCEQIYIDDYNDGVKDWVKPKNGDEPRLTQFILRIFQVFRGISNVLPSQGIISKWDRQKVTNWANSQGTKDLYQDKWNFKNACEIFAVIIRGIQLATNNIARHTQISCCVFFYFDLGHVGQVYTGEGKTLITAFWSIIQVIRGMKVDILSSSSDLASRDCYETKIIYDQFGIKVDTNCDENATEDEDKRKQKYQADIIYGDIGSFERDYLLDSVFIGKSVRGGRTTGSLMIDEIDSSLLDKGESTLYLSHKIPELACLKNLYIQIWASVHSKGNTKGTQEDIKAITESLKLRIDSKNIQIPNILKNLIFKKLPEYVNNAFTAKNMHQNDPYIVKMRKDNGRVVVMDKETGVEQKSTQWSNGLHQFLQLKHQDRLTPESFRAVFISNLKYFQNYKGKIYGLTGTLGSKVERNLLNNLYSLKFFNLPRFTQSSYIQNDPIIVPTLQAQLNMIKMIVKDVCIEQKRPILFICENVSSVLQIEQFIAEFHNQVYKRISADEDLDIGTESNPLLGGEVIVATNIAGRGTDLKVNDKVSKIGGMHVTVTFLPSNIRVEEQAFGRTARKGQQGSGQFCIQFPNSSLSIDEIKLERDRIESYRLAELKKKTIVKLEIEGILFQKFTDLFLKLSDKLKHDFGMKYTLGDQLFSKYYEIQIEFLKNRWAFFLESITEELSEVYKKGKRVTFEFFENFRSECFRNVGDQDGLKFAKSYCELVKIGNFFDEHQFIKMALKAYNKAIKNEPQFCEVALYRKAKALMDKNSSTVLEFFGLQNLYNHVASDVQSQLEKRKQIGLILKQSLNLMQSKVNDLLAGMQVAKAVDQNYKQRAKDVQYENLFELQVQEIVGLYSYHINSIKQSVGQLPTLDVLREIFSCIDDQDMLTKITTYFENNTDIFKLERISTKVQIQQQPYRFIVNGEIIDLPVNLQYCDKEIINVIKGKIGKSSYQERYLIESDFKNVFLTQDSVIQSLKQKGYLNNMEQLVYVPLFDPEKFMLATFKTDGEQKKMMTFLIECSQKFFDIQVFKKNLSSLSLYYNELIQKKLIQIEEKGTLIIKNDKDQMIKEFGERVFNIIQNYIDDALTQGKSEIQIIKSQINVHTSSSEQFTSLKFFMLTKNIIKQKAFNFKLTHHRKDRRNKIKKQVYSLIDQIDLNKSSQSNQILDHFMAMININSAPIIKDQEQKKKDAYLFKDLRFDSPIEVLQKQKDIFKQNLYKAILNKIGINKIKESVEVEVTILATKFSEQQKPVPREIEEMNDLGLEKIIVLQQGWKFDWRAAAVMLIGLAQIGLGVILTATGVGATLGAALIAEGVSDIIYGASAMAQGEFSWTDYAIQKAISLAIAVVTMGCSSFASSAGGQLVKKAGIRLAISQVKKAALKSIIQLIKEKVIKWTVKTFGVLKMFAENLINQGTSIIISKGMIVIEKIVNTVIEPIKKFLFEAIARITENDRDGFLNKCFDTMKSSLSMFLVHSQKFIKMFNQGKDLLQKILHKFQKGGQNYSTKMVAALASMTQIMQSCVLIGKISQQVQETSKVIQKTEKTYSEIKVAYQSQQVFQLTQEQKDKCNQQITFFFNDKTKNAINEIQDKTQKQVDQWASDLIDNFINDKVVTVIESQFDNQMLKLDEDEDKPAEKDEKVKEEKCKEIKIKEKSILEEAQEGAYELLVTCMDKTILTGIENIIQQGAKNLKILCADQFSTLRIVLIKVCVYSYHVQNFTSVILDYFKSTTKKLLDVINNFGSLIISNLKYIGIIFDSKLQIKDARKVALWVKNKASAIQNIINAPNQLENLTSSVTNFFDVIQEKVLSIVQHFSNLNMNIPDEFYNKCVERVDAFLEFLQDWIVQPIMAIIQPLMNKISTKVVNKFQKFFMSLSDKDGKNIEMHEKFNKKLDLFILDFQEDKKYKINWEGLVEKFPVSIDLKGIIETVQNTVEAAEQIVRIEDRLKLEKNKIKQNVKETKHNIKQIAEDAHQILHSKEGAASAMVQVAKQEFLAYVPQYINKQCELYTQYYVEKFFMTFNGSIDYIKEKIIEIYDQVQNAELLYQWIKTQIGDLMDKIKGLYSQIKAYCQSVFSNIIKLLNFKVDLNDPEQFKHFITSKIETLKSISTFAQEGFDIATEVKNIFISANKSLGEFQKGQIGQISQIKRTEFIESVDFYILSTVASAKNFIQSAITCRVQEFSELFLKDFEEFCFTGKTSNQATDALKRTISKLQQSASINSEEIERLFQAVKDKLNEKLNLGISQIHQSIAQLRTELQQTREQIIQSGKELQDRGVRAQEELKDMKDQVANMDYQQVVKATVQVGAEEFKEEIIGKLLEISDQLVSKIIDNIVIKSQPILDEAKNQISSLYDRSKVVQDFALLINRKKENLQRSIQDILTNLKKQIYLIVRRIIKKVQIDTPFSIANANEQLKSLARLNFSKEIKAIEDLIPNLFLDLNIIEEDQRSLQGDKGSGSIEVIEKQKFLKILDQIIGDLSKTLKKYAHQNAKKRIQQAFDKLVS